MRKILILQLDATEEPGFIQNYLKRKKISYDIFRIFKSSIYIPTDFYTHLIVLPSPKDTYESHRYPFLSYAKSVIRDFLFQKKVILGTCMGSQLIADVLGETIAKAKKPEIGFYPIMILKNSVLIRGIDFDRVPVFEWHSMEIATNKKISILARSNNCQTQIFQYRNHVFGMQFHLEINRNLIRSYIKTFDPKKEYGYLINEEKKLASFKQAQETILDNLFML